MKYKIVCINKEGSIILNDNKELEKALRAKSKNQPVVFENGIVLNWNTYSGIVVAVEENREDAYKEKYGIEIKRSSPFAKFLSPKLQLNQEKTTLALEEASEEERRLKNKK